MSNVQPINQVEVIKPQANSIVTPMEMLAGALEKGMPVETIDKLLALSERWDKTQARKAFDIAIAKAKAEIPVITKNATGHNSKRYANFAAIAETIDPIISKHGLSYRFRTVQTDKISVTCVLSHEAGHYEETTLAGPSDTTGNKNAIQAIGSTLTYLQRYTLVQALGLASAEDDDGKAGGNGESITEDQAIQIREMIEAVGADEVAFKKWLKVESIAAIPAVKFKDAMIALEAKRSRNNADR
jgi:hypothetical protein